MSEKSGKFLKQTLLIPNANLAIILVGLALALLLRFSLLGFESIDYEYHTSFWYNALQERGFGVFGEAFANYTPTYLYFLYLTTLAFPYLPDVAAIKLTAILFDFISARLVYLLL
ncbi:MAG: hypothetical protein ACRDIB_18825, partial [Ardenticatenaceae bacterium]